MLRFLTAGESHGKGLTAIIEGLPAGLAITEEDINPMLRRRQRCYGRGTRMKKIEQDRVSISGGVRNGRTIGSPLALHIENKDWAIRKDRKATIKRVPRPGHADLAGAAKYRFDDIQDVIERASARETAIRTAVGATVIRLLSEFGLEILGHSVAIGKTTAKICKLPLSAMTKIVRQSPVYCADEESSTAMCAEIDAAREDGDTLGGIIEVCVANVPPGLGSYVHWDRKLDGRLAQAMLSVPSVKAMEFGSGVRNARRRGSKVHDPFKLHGGKIARTSNRAGGLEGGVTNGQNIIVRGFAKPISSLRKPLPSVNLKSKTVAKAPYVRSDVCVVPAITVVAEAMVAWIIAQSFVEKFGGDSIDEIRENFESSASGISFAE